MPDAALQAVDARLAACLLAVDPALGGAVVRPAHEGATRAWIAALHRAQDEAPAPRRLPLSVSDDRLLGGVDLVATLAARRRVVARGLLAEAHRGTVVVPLVECVAAPVVAHLAAALDAGVVVVEREGVAERHDARFVVVAVASPREDDGAVPAALADRLAF
ncbi:MAG: magnesium chelatase subunit D, partial [Gemmatirosa sp.]